MYLQATQIVELCLDLSLPMSSCENDKVSCCNYIVYILHVLRLLTIANKLTQFL